MKALYLLPLLLLLNVTNLVAQNCTQAISNFVFQQRKTELSNQNRENQRISVAKQMLENNCFDCQQIKELSEMLYNDFYKLDFCKSAYNKVVDKTNFYEVYNSFSSFSTVFMLHDYVLEQRSGGNGSIGIVTPLSLNFPNLNYPNAMGYNNARKCENPINEQAFMPLAREVVGFANDIDKMVRLDLYLNNYCLTTSQIMKFATLLQDDTNRLTYLKKAYSKVFDLNNYSLASQVLQFSQNQNNFGSFVGSNGVGGSSVPTTCTVTVADMADIKQRIQKEGFDNTKMNLAKNIIRVKKCFTCAQVKEIVALYSFSDSKMNMAQFCWEFTIDRDNYYTITDAFTFPSDREKLLKFIASKQ